MRRLLTALVSFALVGCGATEPTVEHGGEAVREPVSRTEARVDALLEDLDDVVDEGRPERSERFFDSDGRMAIAQMMTAHGPELVEATRGTPTATGFALLVGGVFGAHDEPLVAEPANRVGVALLEASGAHSAERQQWLFPELDPATVGDPVASPLDDEALREGLAVQRVRNLRTLRSEGLGRCVRGTYLQSFEPTVSLYPEVSSAWAESVERIWVARLDCFTSIGLFLFSECTGGELLLLGFRFLTEEDYRDALALLETLDARVAPERSAPPDAAATDTEDQGTSTSLPTVAPDSMARWASATRSSG